MFTLAQLQRLSLQEILSDILDSDHVYFQPPVNVQIEYPCIVYAREKINTTWADGNPYSLYNRYSVTVIDQNPDSEFPDKVAALPMCAHDRSFVAENLNHTVFKLFF